MKIEFENGSVIETVDRGDSIKSDRYYQQMRRLNGIDCLTCLCVRCVYNDGKNCNMEENSDYHTCYQCDAVMTSCNEHKIETS